MKKLITYVLIFLSVSVFAEKGKSKKHLTYTYTSNDSIFVVMPEIEAVKTITLEVDSVYKQEIKWVYDEETNTNTCEYIKVMGKTEVQENYTNLSSSDKTKIDNLKAILE